MASWPPIPAGGGGGGGGVKIVRASGDWFFPLGEAAPTTMGPVVEQLYTIPWAADSSFTLNAMQVDITAGVALASVGMGLYADNGGRPGALILDAGTVPGTATGPQVATGFATPPSIVAATVYWLAVVAHGAGPTLRSCGTNSVNLPIGIRLANGTAPTAQAGSVLGFTQTGVTGPLPATFTGTTLANNSIRLALQVA